MSRRKKVLPPRPTAVDCPWPPARIAALRRKAFKKMHKLRGSRELQYLMAREARRAGNEKAPGLAAEGSFNPVIPGEDPG